MSVANSNLERGLVLRGVQQPLSAPIIETNAEDASTKRARTDETQKIKLKKNEGPPLSL